MAERQDELKEAGAEQGAAVLNVRRDARHQLARLGPVVIGEAQRLDAVVETIALLERDLLRRVLGQVLAEVEEDGTQALEEEDQAGSEEQRRLVAAGDALVDGVADDDGDGDGEGSAGEHAAVGEDQDAQVRPPETEEAPEDLCHGRRSRRRAAVVSFSSRPRAVIAGRVRRLVRRGGRSRQVSRRRTPQRSRRLRRRGPSERH